MTEKNIKNGKKEKEDLFSRLFCSRFKDKRPLKQVIPFMTGKIYNVVSSTVYSWENIAQDCFK